MPAAIHAAIITPQLIAATSKTFSSAIDLLFLKLDQHRHRDKVDQPQRQHDLPGQRHELIEAEPRPAPADEHEEQDHCQRSWRQHDDAQDRL